MLDNQPTRARVRYLLERGRAFNSSGQPERAKPLFLEALRVAEQAGEDFFAVDSAHMLGIVEPSEAGLEWNLKALSMAAGSSSEKAQGWQGSLRNNLGWSYHDLGRFDEALAQFQAGLTWQREQNREGPARIAAWTVGRCLRSLGRFEEALAVQEDNLRAIERSGGDAGFAHEELGECLMALDRLDEAETPFFQCLRAAEQGSMALRTRDPNRLERMRRIGES